ncbi:hypothetical protein Tco_0346814, partial [Tanacetum coccineum]
GSVSGGGGGGDVGVEIGGGVGVGIESKHKDNVVDLYDCFFVVLVCSSLEHEL